MIRRPPRSTLFPPTPLFRSVAERQRVVHPVVVEPQPSADRHQREGGVDTGTGAGRLLETEAPAAGEPGGDRKSTRLNSSHANISYAVFCLKKKKKRITRILR